MKSAAAIFSLLVPCLLAAASAQEPGAGSGAAPEVSFELAPATSTVLLGAAVDITGWALAPKGSTLSSALPSRSTGAFEILGAEAALEKAEGARSKFRIRLKAAAFELGALVLPPLPWTLRTPEGVERTVLSPAVRLESIAPYSAQQSQEPRDIRGPWSPSPWPWLLLAGLLLWAALWAWDRRKRSGPRALEEARAKEADSRSPEQIALDALDALLQQAGGLEAKEFYDGVSDALRAYFERRHGVQALQMTTYDLLRALLHVESARALRGRIRALLDRCDLAKFARWSPAASERGRDIEEAKELVRLSAPPSPQAQTQAPAAEARP